MSCSSPFPPLQKAKCFCLFLVCHTNHSRFEKSSDQTPIDVNKSSFEVFQIYHNRKLLQPFSSVFNKRPAALKFVTSSENWRLQKSCHQLANHTLFFGRSSESWWEREDRCTVVGRCFFKFMNVWCFALLLAPATKVMREMFQRMTALWYVSRVMWGTEFRREMPREAEKWVSSSYLRLGLIVNFNLVYIIFWCWEKVPPWSVRGKAFNSLNEVQGILDLFEFFERLQGIVDI